MTTVERRDFFERLCQLRELYRFRGDRDSVGMTSMSDVIAEATQLLDDPDDSDALLSLGSRGQIERHTSTKPRDS